MKARVKLKYSVTDCLWKPAFDCNSPQTPSKLISLTIAAALRALTML